MSGSETPTNDTWPSLILEFAARLGFHERAPVCCEKEYREAFTLLCNEHRERDAQRLLTRIRRQHGPMIDFAAAIDAVNHFETPDGLEPLIWQLLTKAVEGALEAETPLVEFLKNVHKLNSELAPFNSELLTRFPYEPKVQKPLQDLFKEYMSCYMTMFSDFATSPTDKFYSKRNISSTKG